MENTKSKIRIPIKQNAKEMKMGDVTVTIPVLSIYHTKYFKNLKADNFYDVVSPLIENIYPNPNKSQFSFLIVMLLVNNGALNRIYIDEDTKEKFDVFNLVMHNKTEFEVDGEIYKFDQSMPSDIFDMPLEYLSRKSLDGINFDVRGNSFKFIKVYYEYFKDLSVEGSLGTVVNGLSNILDLFSSEELNG